MRQITFIFGFLFVFCFAYSQDEEELMLDTGDLYKKQETANWLYEYDIIAWWTSDSVMTNDMAELQRLGREWFCFKTDDNNWHAIYGKYHLDSNFYDLIFHYVVDTASYVKRINEKVDTSILNSYARAIQTAYARIKNELDSTKIRFNHFIKKNDDNTLSVWIFPSFQGDGTAIYGKEFIFSIDESGKNILKDESYRQSNLRGFKVGEPREIWLDYSELEQPTLGSIFFVWYYKKYFTQIFINNKNYISTAMKNDDKNYIWVTTQKDMKQEEEKDNKE